MSSKQKPFKRKSPKQKTPDRKPSNHPRRPAQTSWEDVATWYNGWVGKRGSHYHRKVALPTVMELLELRPKDKVLDIGAGSGVLAPHVARAGGRYVGIDLSPSLVKLARRYHGDKGSFIRGDARQLSVYKSLRDPFDAAVFLLSLQDMQPLHEVLSAASEALKPEGRLVIFMVHPCFRVPRQSGWGWDRRRKLSYRRVDRYLSPLSVPMRAHARGTTRSFHRPLGDYVAALSAAGLGLETLLELPDEPIHTKRAAAHNPDIPLFLALRASK